MGRIAKQGLSHHKTKGFRISIGKTASGGYKTVWLGHERLLASYHANVCRGQFENMRMEGREVWTKEDEEVVQWFVVRYRAMQHVVGEYEASKFVGRKPRSK